MRRRGLRTYRRTFRQLHEELSSGPNQRLQLAGCGTIHAVYLRAGYQCQDYIAFDLDSKRCCDALRAARVFIERHRVAVNATVSQQLATSKRMQLYLVSHAIEALTGLGFAAEEVSRLQRVFAEMRVIDGDTAHWLSHSGT